MKIPTANLSVMKKRKGHAQKTSLTSLPNDSLVDILTQVASSSFTDFYNVKLSCKDFFKASEDKCIMRKISINKFPAISWRKISEEASLFLKTCKDNGNPESLYREGMMEYFSQVKVESGVEHLKRAVEIGHMEASYVYGIILLCQGGESNQEEGLKLLNAVKKSRKLEECRKKTRDFVGNMWIANKINVHWEGLMRPWHDYGKTSCCKNGVGRRRRGGGWSWSNDIHHEDEEEKRGAIDYCDGCRWEEEVNAFCRKFR